MSLGEKKATAWGDFKEVGAMRRGQFSFKKKKKELVKEVWRQMSNLAENW